MALERFLRTYQQLNRDNLELLNQIYCENVRFCDPAHSINGLTNLRGYFAQLYAHVTSITFAFDPPHACGAQVFVQWRMRLCHPRLQGGKEIEVPGISCLHFADDGRVDEHRDYFDLGILLYEQLPLVGSLVRAIKRRFAA